MRRSPRGFWILSQCMLNADYDFIPLMKRRSFSDQRARQRALTSGAANILPEHVYRTYYENSATLCSRVSKDTHTKHREVPDLSIEPGNAFQAIGRRVLNKAVTKEGIERHLKWQKKHDPSQWISVFDDLCKSMLKRSGNIC